MSFSPPLHLRHNPFWRGGLVGLLLGAGLAAGAAEAMAPLRLVVTQPDYRLECFPRVRQPGQRQLLLALGGGAAKGIAHAGVLQRLQEEGLPPDGIAGTSMGAFMGAMYSTGYSGFAIEALLNKVDMGALLLDREHRSPGETLWEQENENVSFLSVELRPGAGVEFSPGSSPGLELKRALEILLARGSMQASGAFDRLRVPFRAVSTNLQTGRADAPAQGELATAVRASMSIPGVFRPVLLNGEQHLDGMLVQNLPVETARSMAPAGVVAAVEVGSRPDKVQQTSLLGIAMRTLDVSVEERTRISREAADLLLRPSTDTISYLDFHQTVAAAVREGRAAFDQNLDQLERLLYGPEQELPAPSGPVQVLAPEPLRSQLEELARATLPAGPRVRRHYLRLLRRAYAAGLVQNAELRWVDGRMEWAAEPFPVLRRIDIQAPREWAGLVARKLQKERLDLGTPFNPVALGRALDGCLLDATVQGHPLLHADGTRFDPATGTLVIAVGEYTLSTIRVDAGTLSPARSRYLEHLFQPFQGHPLQAKDFTLQLMMAEKRLGLEEIQLSHEAGTTNSELRATPVPNDRVTVEGTLAYETTWQMQGSLQARAQRLLNTDLGFRLHVSSDRIWTGESLALARPLDTWPRVAWEARVQQLEHHFLYQPLAAPLEASGFPEALSGRTLRARILGLGLSARGGPEDRGLLRLEASHSWDDLQPSGTGLSLPRLEQLMLQGELDTFDRYLFPTQGTLLRVRLGQGWQTASTAATDRAYQLSYARLRHLQSLGAWGSLDGDLETGAGWHLPLSQWYSVGGPDFLAGTPSGAFYSPNFVMARVGMPVHVLTAFGVHLQFAPRLDAGYIGASSPGQMRAGERVRGAGVTLRSELGRWYCEFAAGRWSSTGPDQGERIRLNVLLGAHPFDLWSQGF
ncbi:MAG: patatin-like phospholipase family protein [Holophaga sp.]|nr:patatin-like phospholipase family protein [Holophaga sp.]